MRPDKMVNFYFVNFLSFFFSQGHDWNCNNSHYYRLVQLLGFKDLHLCVGHGWTAVVGCLPLCSVVWSFCAHLCLLENKNNSSSNR